MRTNMHQACLLLRRVATDCSCLGLSPILGNFLNLLTESFGFSGGMVPFSALEDGKLGMVDSAYP